MGEIDARTTDGPQDTANKHRPADPVGGPGRRHHSADRGERDHHGRR